MNEREIFEAALERRRGPLKTLSVLRQLPPVFRT
jgi:hypothetical protein